jgi:hypothetical protein
MGLGIQLRTRLCQKPIFRSRHASVSRGSNRRLSPSRCQHGVGLAVGAVPGERDLPPFSAGHGAGWRPAAGSIKQETRRSFRGPNKAPYCKIGLSRHAGARRSRTACGARFDRIPSGCAEIAAVNRFRRLQTDRPGATPPGRSLAQKAGNAQRSGN